MWCVCSIYTHVYVFVSAYAHREPLCTFSHGLASSLSPPPILFLKLCWKSAPAISLSLSALLGAGVPSTCMATMAFHLGDEIHRCPMPVQRVLLSSELSLWLPPTYSWNPSKKHFHAVSRMGKKGPCSLLAGCWTRVTQVKWIILSQLQLSDSVNLRLNALEETSSNRQTERGQTFLNDALSISFLNYAHLNKILDSSNYWNWRFHPDTVLHWDIAQLAY